MEPPVGVEVAVVDESAELKDGFGTVQAPTAADDVEAAGGDQPARAEDGVVTEVVEVAGEIADPSIDALAPGSAQPALIGLSGDLGGGAGGLAVEDRGEMAGDLTSASATPTLWKQCASPQTYSAMCM